MAQHHAFAPSLMSLLSNHQHQYQHQHIQQPAQTDTCPTKHAFPTSVEYDCCCNGLREAAPPLDTVTITTSSESSSTFQYHENEEQDDDHSTCSSLSCEEFKYTPPVPPRSIFPSYWKAEGFEAAPFKRHVAIPAPFEEDSMGSPTTSLSPRKNQNDQDILLQEVAANATPQGLKRTQARRSIFGMDQLEQEHEKTPALSFSKHRSSSLVDNGLFRKTKSAPTLRRKSALRSGRFANSCRETENDTSIQKPGKIRRNVSFDDQVRVAVFRKTTEQWAAPGWSDLFA